MTEPTCRVCYAHSLSEPARQRFFAEPVTSCIHYCADHQPTIDLLHSIPLIKSTPLPAGFTFPRARTE